MKKKPKQQMPSVQIDSVIRTIRGERVMLDSDLARIYGVSTARLNQQVRRNIDRVPADFIFQLTREEFDRLMLQNATSKMGRGDHRIAGHKIVIGSQKARDPGAGDMNTLVA